MAGFRQAAWLLGAVLVSSGAMAQTDMRADYERAVMRLADRTTPLVDHAISGQQWLSDGSLLYRESVGAKQTLLRFDPKTGTTRVAFNAKALADTMNLAAGGKGRAVLPEKLPALHAVLQADGSLQLTASTGVFRCDSKGCSAVPLVELSSEPGVASPDGRYEAFVRHWNLWLRDVNTGKDRQLTFDGQPDYGYATDNAGWKHTDNAIVVWSPDSTKIATFQQDQRKTKTMTLVGTNVGEPKVEQWKYPFAGDADVTLIERVIIDLAEPTAKLIRLQMPADQHRSTCSDDIACANGWEDVQWASDGKTLAFVSTDRGHKSATLRVADASTGVVRDVFTETVATQYQSAPTLSSVNWRYLPESNEFLWFSQKSNWGHVYLHDLSTGKEKRQLTHGDWNVSKIAHLDRKQRQLLIQGVGREAGRDPYFSHLYRLSLEGGDVQLLTPEDANHQITVAEQGQYFLDVYSTIATPPVAVIRDHDGKQVAELAKADLTRLKASGWVPPEAFSVKARDGETDLYGQLFKPSNFDASKQYPIITYIYPGPQVGSVRSRSFLPAHLDHQALAELGFIVITLDGMGTPQRSKAFQDVSYANMADNTLPDQVAALAQLGQRYAWIDTTRAGMWGHSGGGNATTAAMFRYPEVYKVGIAESGNHDNLTYEDDWAERYHGLLENNPDGSSNYTGQDNAPLAKNLQGKLFLLHGMMDDNVPPQSTLLVVDALIKANKDFDLLLLPHARHGFGADSYYVMRRRWDYFVTHLLGVQPPKNFEVKMQP